MKVLINYSNAKYQKAQQFNTWTGIHIAKFDKVFSFGPDDIDKEYKNKHKGIFSYERGNGLWLWKPYFINKVMSECEDGDVIFYADSGSFFVKKIDKLINSLRDNEKIWVSDCPLLESCFTKVTCLEKMECNLDTVKYSNQIQATYLMIVCCDESRKFIKQWLNYCEDIELISPKGTLMVDKDRGNDFVVHREDQSILSLLCKKHGIIPHKDPSQRAKFPETFFNTRYSYKVPNHPEDNYGTVLFLHKSPNVGFIACTKLVIKMFLSKVRYAKMRRE